MAIAYDAKGAGVNTTSGAGSAITFSDTAAVGADVWLVINNTGNCSMSAVTYDSASMTSVASVNHNNSNVNGTVRVYHLVGAGTGASVTVRFIPSAAVYVQAQLISMTGVGSVAAPTTVYGMSTSPSTGAVSLSAGQVALGFLAYGYPSAIYGPISSPTGGTNRHLVNGGLNASGFTVSDGSTSGVTFGATLTSASARWSGVAIVLSPAANGTIVQPSEATITITGGTPTVTGPSQVLTPGGATIAIISGTPSVSSSGGGGGGAVVTYSATGVGQSSATAISSFSFNSTATAGDYVLLAVQTRTTLSNITYGGVTMSLLGSVNNNNSAGNGTLYMYELYNVSGGAQTVAGTMGASTTLIANTFAYNGVATSALNYSAYGQGTSISTGSQTCPSNGMLVAALGVGSGVGAAISNPTGGTNRHLTTANNVGLSVTDSTATTTFGLTTGFNYTASLVAALSPPAGSWVVPSATTITVIGSIPSTIQTIPPTGASFTLSGGTPDISQTSGLSPAGLTITLVGSVPSTIQTIPPVVSSLTLSGGPPAVVQYPDNPFNPTLTKLQAGQSVRHLYIGDSTVQGLGDVTFSGGWPTWVGLMLGATFGVTVKNGNSTISNAGSSNTITVTNMGLGGTTLANDEGRLANGDYTVTPAPDAIFIQDGINDMSLGGLTGAQFTTAMQNFVTNVRALYPTVPIIVTTCNTTNGDNYAAGFSMMTQGLVGQSLPLATAFAASTTMPSVYVLDTRQAYGSVYTPSLMYDGLHPNINGYKAQAAFVVKALAHAVVTYPSSGTLTLTRGTPTVLIAGGSIPPNLFFF